MNQADDPFGVYDLDNQGFTLGIGNNEQTL
jgi:hypothetical protein